MNKMSMKKLPVGISDFKEMVTGNYRYVDKTLFIKEIIDRGDKILLLPRPRRFGKTLNLSMLKYFYDCCTTTGQTTPETNKTLFDSLAIQKEDGEYIEKMGKHPVIFLSFGELKKQDWTSCLGEIKQLIKEEYLKHKYMLDSPKLNPHEADYFKRIIDLSGNKVDYGNSLEKLLIFLNRFYGKQVVILIDDYDAPVHAGFIHGYYEEAINFVLGFLCSALKDMDQYLEKSILTGTVHISNDSIFSGLNNIAGHTLLSRSFNDKFGFTEGEVNALLKDFGVTPRHPVSVAADRVKEWYNGYRFGGTTIYNPWSIINFLSEGAKKFKPYWVNTSDNQLVNTLLSKGGKELKQELELLIRGETIEKIIDDNIILKHIETNDNALWSFLLMGGYLKPTSERMAAFTGKMHYTLTIPNMEVKTLYIGIIEHFFADKIDNRKLETMLKALLAGDIDLFEEIFGDYVIKSMSFFDTMGEPESVYHAFVMGLLLWITPEYQVKSNRESGYGRYDIMIIPRDTAKLGFIIEFKKTRKKETLETAAKSALAQIEEKKYETELIEKGIKNYKKLAIVFKGKDVIIKEG